MTRQGAWASGLVPITERRRRAREWDFVALRRGLKRVIKVEGVDDPDGAERALVRGFPDLFVRWRSVGGLAGRVELFAGRDARDVAEAIRLAGVIEHAFEEATTAAATAQLGELLGYPPCCARAYGAEPAALRRGDAWLRVRRRLDAPERVDPGFHPMLMSHVPCALTCAATSRLVRRTTMANPHAPPGVWAALPAVLLLDRPGELVLVRPLSPVGARFDYEFVAARTHDPRQGALARGEWLAMEPGRLIVGAGRYELTRFAGDAFLWSPEAVFDRHWWEVALEERCRATVGDAVPELDPAPGWSGPYLERSTR